MLILLAKNKKTFTAASDGGYAATLLSRGIVRVHGQRGQNINLQNVPMTIPDHLWDVLIQCKNEFPYNSNGNEPYPWRVHCMAM